MKSRAPLALMEQLIMLLVFAMSAALCLHVFALSGKVSRRIEARDNAITAVQNAAEGLKIAHGNFEQQATLCGGTHNSNGWQICYDADWQPTDEEFAVYLVTAQPVPTSVQYLGTADISAYTAGGELLFGLTVAWQEVSHG